MADNKLPADGIYYNGSGKTRTKTVVYTIPIDVELLEQELATLKARLAEIPPDPSEAELLKWAREHYPATRMNTGVERARIEKRMAEIEKETRG